MRYIAIRDINRIIWKLQFSNKSSISGGTMPGIADVSTELHDINTSIVKLNETLKTSTSTIYRGIILAAKIQSAQTDYERNTAIKEADDFLIQITQNEKNQNGGEND